jgi:hypothetical protein
MTFARLDAEGQSANHISQRAGAANDDRLFPMAKALTEEPQPEKDWVQQFIFEGPEIFPERFGARTQRGGH